MVDRKRPMAEYAQMVKYTPNAATAIIIMSALSTYIPTKMVGRHITNTRIRP